LINESALQTDDQGWFVSSFSNGNANCVQIKFDTQGAILVRDSKDRRAASPILTMPPHSWTHLLNNISDS
jgi:hypothetical protein